MSTAGPFLGTDTKEASGEAPVIAAFSPSQPQSSAQPHQRSTILVGQRSPLLVATPPQITRALAYSFPFIQPLSRLAGLLSWTTKDPYESFLLLCTFWALTLYGDVVLRTMAPLVFAVSLVYAMYARRHSPLSSTVWASRNGEDREKAGPHKRKESQGSAARHHKSLDEIVAALQLFTSRCNIMLDPLLRFTDFLSTQTTATSATTRPALTALFFRLLMLLPVWYALTLSPLLLITTKRTVLVIGTLVLSWHSRPARVIRVILWRSRTVRRSFELVTGLSFSAHEAGPQHPQKHSTLTPRGARTAHDIANSLAASRHGPDPTGSQIASSEGIQFTFGIFENQRRWIGIGWTSSMLAYERAAWTDEELNATAPADRFQLPAVEGGLARWQWCKDSQWQVDFEYTDETEQSHDKKSYGKPKSGRQVPDQDDEGWVYYDNKWLHGRRGIDGWGRYTRQRRWIRNAELVEITPITKTTPTNSPSLAPEGSGPRSSSSISDTLTPSKRQAAPSLESTSSDGKENAQSGRKRNWFRRRRSASNVTDASSATAVGSEADGIAATPSSHKEKDNGEDDDYVPLQFRGRQGAMESSWGVGEDAGMGLG